MKIHQGRTNGWMGQSKTGVPWTVSWRWNTYGRVKIKCTQFSQPDGLPTYLYICGSICVVICSSVHILMGNCNNFRMSCRRAFVMRAPVKAEFGQCIRRDVGWMDEHQATESFLVAIYERGGGCNGDWSLPRTEC